jgi:5-(carboxyamino)imidazole ribonucleotide mutase
VKSKQVKPKQAKSIHKKKLEPATKKKTSQIHKTEITPKHKHPLVGLVMGSSSDLKWMDEARQALKKIGISFETKVLSAHRTPGAMSSYAATAESRGIRVIIAGAGGAAHLPGMIAANTTLPVIGVPCPVGPLQGEDALWSIVQMPKGVPVATVAIGNSWNAGILAAQILSTSSTEVGTQVREKLRAYKKEMEQLVDQMNVDLPKS